MLLYCIRHGQTEHNADGRIQGQSESVLSELGWRQSRATAEALAAAPIEAVYSSPLRRALDGARLIGDRLGLAVQVDDRLKELNAGVFQGLSWDEVGVRYPEEAARWRSHDPDYRIPGGESRRELMRRAAEVFAELQARTRGRAAIIAHGGILAAAFKALLGIPAERNPFQLHNASISHLSWDGQYRLTLLNSVAHLGGELGDGGEL